MLVLFTKNEGNSGMESFVLAFTDILKKLTNHYADTIDDIAQLQNKFKEEYKEYQEYQKSPSKFLEMIANMNESQATQAFGMFKIIIKFSTVQQKVRNLWVLDNKEQKKLAEELRSLSTDIETLIERIGGEQNVSNIEQKA